MHLRLGSIFWRWFIAMLLSWMSAASFASAKMIELRLQEVVNVSKQNVVLSDICLVTGSDLALQKSIADLDVGLAPRMGYKQTITQQYIRKIISRNFRNTEIDIKWSGSRDVQIVTQGRVYPFSEIQRHAHDFFLSVIDKHGLSATIEESTRASDIDIPTGVVELRPRMTGSFFGKRNCVWVDIYIDELFYRSMQVWVVADIHGSVLVAKHNIEKRTEVYSKDFMFKDVSINGNPEDYASLSVLASATLMVSSLMKGEVLLVSQLVKVPDVVGGSMVNVDITQGTINIRLQGIARQDANQGEVLKIKLLHNNESISARVIGKQLVTII